MSDVQRYPFSDSKCGDLIYCLTGKTFQGNIVNQGFLPSLHRVPLENTRIVPLNKETYRESRTAVLLNLNPRFTN